MVDSIPYNLVISACCHTPTDGEYKFPLKCLFEQSQHLISLFVIRQVCNSVCAWEINITSFPSMHTIIDSDSSTLRIPIAVHVCICVMSHGPMRLIPYHFAINCGAYRALYPILIFYKGF